MCVCVCVCVCVHVRYVKYLTAFKLFNPMACFENKLYANVNLVIVLFAISEFSINLFDIPVIIIVCVKLT